MVGRPAVDPEIRFWKRVKKTRGCWLYRGYQQKRGYCQFWTPKDGHIYAHVFSYQLHKGKVPKGKLVCHKCDVGNCIRPEHLWIGTQKENIADMIRKGRTNYAYGVRNARWKNPTRGFKGYKHSLKSRQKMSKSQTGRKHSLETRRKMNRNHWTRK